MREWLTNALLESHANLSEEAMGYVLGRGLPSALAREMKVGVWVPPPEASPDPVFNKRNGDTGYYREGWLTIPMWSPRGTLLGVEFRTWEGEKEVRDFRLPESKWIPAFMGLTPSTLQRCWDGGDVWLVEGVFDISLQHAVPAKDVVLACGTARVSRLQFNFIHRFLSPHAMVHVIFDMDETGRKQITGFTDDAGKRIPGVPERLDRVGIRSSAPSYRGGKDPGEIWEDGGKGALRYAFNL
jgi:hypothetical protein